MEELRYAVLSEQVNVVRTLLKKVTERELHEYSEMANSFPIRRPLLHIAVLKKCPVILKLLLDKRIFQILINERDAEYYTPLMRAADVGSGECVRLLMDAGANTTLSVFKSPDDRHRSNQTSKFVRRRNNTATSSGTTATHIAAEGGYVDVLSLLVQKLDVRQGLEDPDSLGRTPLMVAVENGHVGCFNLLASVGARYVDVVDYKYQTVLHLSAKKGKTEMLRELLRKPEVRKMVNDRDKQSFTALSWSVYNGNVDCMDELLDAGADQKVKDENNNTLLHLACFQGHSHVLKELLPYSLRFMKSTPQREETASLKKNPSSFSSMLTSHEDILNLRNHTRPSGRTVYWWYMRDLKQRNKQGSNCFHLASTSGDVKCLELLLSCFASPGHTDLGEIVCPDIKEVDGYGLTPLYISARAGSAECVKFLIDYGGNLAFSSPVDSHNVIGASQEKVLDVLFQNVDNFDQLISEVLDECVDISTDIGSERKFLLDLSVLCPEGVNKMAVTKLLYEQNRTPSLKEHPLILAFIQLEWYPQKFILWYRFVNYILFLACFSWYVAHPNLNESTDPIRWTLMPLTILVFMFVAPILLPGNGSMIFRLGKTTLMVIPAILSIITTSLPNGPQWKAVSILITWLILPFYTNVIPAVGKQFAVFLNILREIFKYSIVLFSVLIGFSVSFYVLNKQYEDLTFGEFGKWFLYTSLILMRGGEDYQSNIHSNATIEYDLSNSISRVINEQKLAGILIYLIFIFTVVFSLINMFIVIAFISGEKIILCSDNSFKRHNQVNMLFEKKELEKWLDWAFCKCGRKSTDVLSPTENIISVKTGIFSPEIDAGLWKIVTLRKNKVIKNRDDTEIKYEVDKVVEKKLQTMFKIISNQTLPSQNVDQKNIF